MGILWQLFRLFNSKQMVSNFFANVRIWNVDLLCRKRPLCQLSHNHCPKRNVSLFNVSLLVHRKYKFKSSLSAVVLIFNEVDITLY